MKDTIPFSWCSHRHKASLVLLACSLWSGTAWSQGEKPTPVAEQAAELMSTAMQKGKVRVIVGLRRPEANSTEAQHRLGIESAQSSVLVRLQQISSFKPNTVKRFTVVPGMALEADLATLQTLASDPNVVSIKEDVAVPPTLYQKYSLN